MYRHQRLVGAAAILLWAAVGCWPDGGSGQGRHSISQRSALPAPALLLAVESLVVPCPAKEEHAYEELWQRIRSAGTPESIALWQENGLRAGVLSSPLPSQLQDWLQEETAAGHGSLKTFHHRQETFLPTGGVRERCSSPVRLDLAAAPVNREWEQVIPGLSVQPKLHKTGALLACEPRLQYQERPNGIRPAPDASRFLRSEEPRYERFPPLQLEVELMPADYLLIGALTDRRPTLGSTLFGPTNSTEPADHCWRLLLLRVRTPPAASAADLPVIPPPYLRR